MFTSKFSSGSTVKKTLTPPYQNAVLFIVDRKNDRTAVHVLFALVLDIFQLIPILSVNINAIDYIVILTQSPRSSQFAKPNQSSTLKPQPSNSGLFPLLIFL